MEGIFEIVKGEEETEVALLNTIAEANKVINFATVIRDGAQRLLEEKFPARPIEEDIAEIQEELEIHFGLLKLYNSKPERYLEDRYKVLRDIAALQARLAEMGQ